MIDLILIVGKLIILLFTEDIKACAPMAVPVHGSMKCFSNRKGVLNFKSGTRCHFWCEKGFDLKGSVVRLCNSSGAWSGDNTRCVR